MGSISGGIRKKKVKVRQGGGGEGWMCPVFPVPQPPTPPPPLPVFYDSFNPNCEQILVLAHPFLPLSKKASPLKP